MPQKQAAAVENNFTKGLITSSTGLNFPENAATDADNSHFGLTGITNRRLGIDYETNFSISNANRSNAAVNTYRWNNAGGDGLTQILVTQVGNTLYFYLSSASTDSNPLSTQKLVSTVNFLPFQTVGSVAVASQSECQFADGNGYLFVFHPDCQPFYCTYSSGTIATSFIDIQIRDFGGVIDGLGINTRPTSLSVQHNYNLLNQGWILGSTWTAFAGTTNVSLGSQIFTVAAGIVGIAGGQAVSATGQYGSSFAGTVTSYVGTTLTINVTSVTPPGFPTTIVYTIIPLSTATISTWNGALGNYPSNSDVWWYYKNASGVFDPATTINNVTFSAGKAPRGHFLLNAFTQNRSGISGLTGLTSVTTLKRPSNGAWFQGRVWYTGLNSQQTATGDANNYSWTENIYFSQVVNSPDDFGACYQTNDPTSENLFDLLPTDGGIIVIQGAGTIYKLFPIQNGMLVFAANGVWFITGSQGIGFAANDYTITKLSNIKSISGTSFINVLGLPFFWNEEGIYAVTPSQNGSLTVEPITVGVIQEFYDAIPAASKRYARGDYDPIDYNIQWVYRDIDANSIGQNYEFNRILNYNTYNKAFFPYSVSQDLVTINGVNYITYPGSITSPEPGFKYLTSAFISGTTYNVTFSDEHDTSYLDFKSANGVGEDYVSYFVIGYKLRGQAQRKFQSGYVYTYSKNEEPTAFRIQGIWDYAISGNSGKYSSNQLINNYKPYAGTIIKRHKIRGTGLVLQLRISSVTGSPFSVIGWATYDTVNAGV